MDSGTTDTYLQSSVRTAFVTAWKDMTGKEYKHSSMSYTEEEILKLPTVLIQLRSDASLNSPSADGLVSTSNIPDAQNPSDLVIAMPASHYMEYNAKTKKYVPRLYFTEGSGGGEAQRVVKRPSVN